MPTTVVKTIGTSGRDYSTLQAWEDAAPANLVTADEVWQGQCYNDTEFANPTTILTIGGSTTDATRYKELTVATGQSFQDNANVRTNALTYNQANGVGINIANTYTGCIIVTDDNVRVSRLQLKGTHLEFVSFSGAGTGVFKDIVALLGPGVNDGSTFTYNGAGSCLWANVLLIVDSATAGPTVAGFFGATGGGTVTWLACAVVRTTDNTAAGRAYYTGYSPVVMQSCVSFGITTVFANPHSQSTTGSKNNATDQSSGLPGTSNQHSVTYSSVTPFTNAASSGQDWRAIAATSLAANGFLDATNAPNDISGFVRPANPFIGVWEVVTKKTFLLH